MLRKVRSPYMLNQQPQLPVAYASLITISSAFNTLFRVLFTFPSQYFCAIGLIVIFSFRWNQSPILRLQSQTTRLKESAIVLISEMTRTGLSPSLASHSRKLQYHPNPLSPSPNTTFRAAARTTRFSLSFVYFIRHYYRHPCWFLFLRLLICLNSAGNRA